MARYVAKNIVAAGLAKKCEVQLSYAIGVAQPVSALVETFGTETAPAEAIEKAVNGHYGDNRLDTRAAVREVVKQFGYERTLYVLAVTVKHKEHDGRISRANKDWARTVPVFENPDTWGHDRNVYFVVDQCHPGLTDLFVTAARHEHLLSLPLKAADIKAEALNILCQFQDAREPNSPGGTHFMADRKSVV